MILIGLGSNLPHRDFGPREILAGALKALVAEGVDIVAVSCLYETEPVPPKPVQPWYANAVAAVATERSPDELLAVLQRIEADFGRARDAHWASRTLDLDLLAHGDLVLPDMASWERLVAAGETVHEFSLELPHPQMHRRRFVMAPLAEIAPRWAHPVLGRTATEILSALPAEEGIVRRIPDVALYKP